MPRKRIGFRVNFTVLVITLVVCALDAASKAWVRHALAAHAVHVGGAVWLRLEYNSGISFSLNQSDPLVTTIGTLVVTIVVVLVGLNARPGVSAVGFGLMIGGGVANAIDRLAGNPHRVTDFVALGSFPVFNLADVAISAGFLILVVAALRGERLIGR